MTVRGQRHAPAVLPPGKRHATHSTGGWVGPRAGMDRCGKSRPHQDSIPRPSSPQRVAVPTTLSWPTPIAGIKYNLPKINSRLPSNITTDGDKVIL